MFSYYKYCFNIILACLELQSIVYARGLASSDDWHIFGTDITNIEDMHSICWIIYVMSAFKLNQLLLLLLLFPTILR